VRLEGQDIYGAGVSATGVRRHIGMVFQRPTPFPTMSIRDNVAAGLKTLRRSDRPSKSETSELVERALKRTALWDEVKDRLGASAIALSGGQQQRLCIARALATSPKVLLLDDFTARVDTGTEQKILANVQRNYPGLTLLSVTQKIASVEHYDQIILMMQGEIVAVGKHDELMKTSPDYVQLFNSQQSTSNYELQSK